MLDTTREIEVPEGVELSLAVAGLVSRSLAFIIDLMVRWAVLAAIAGVLGYLGNFGQGLYLIIIFLVEWFYPVLFEVFNHGQTIGKKSMGIMVINDDGTPIDWSSSIVRNLLRFADFLPMLFGFGILSMLINKDFKRLGDLAAGTLVVHKRRIKEIELSYEEEGIAPKIPLTLAEQSAIISFAERNSLMSESRARELAGYLGPWIEQEHIKKNPENQAVILKRLAKWLRGHQ
ncbi:MAG: RDD family protein [Kangiellaceae bacterium]|nr:RDD family protein [Kangiellaceae bacterium]